MEFLKKKKYIIILLVSVILSLTIFILEEIQQGSNGQIIRNKYGQGDKLENYEVKIEGKTERIQIEVGEQEYSHQEIQDIFENILGELDQIVLGENESWDHVEKDLNLVSQVGAYPVQIQWGFSSYDVINIDGKIQEECLEEEGTLVELRGILSCGEEQAVYTRNAKIYPPSGTKREKILYEIRKEIKEKEEKTKKESGFPLPKEVLGKTLKWQKKTERRWHYVLIIGVGIVVFCCYREWEQKKQKERRREELLLREYPGLISKFTMLLRTGTTVKNAWEKILQSQEEQTLLAVEMRATLNEINSGLSEAEAYEKFGKRCKLPVYLKFGTMLSQNLRKGSKGLCQLLKVEAIEAFEERKSTARRLGEEASAKLLMPMLGMLLVVLVMVMVPAFLSMQI